MSLPIAPKVGTRVSSKRIDVASWGFAEVAMLAVGLEDHTKGVEWGCTEQRLKLLLVGVRSTAYIVIP